ncbi:unnamed protein product, partial [Effrenium voratum]
AARHPPVVDKDTSDNQANAACAEEQVSKMAAQLESLQQQMAAMTVERNALLEERELLKRSLEGRGRGVGLGGEDGQGESDKQPVEESGSGGGAEETEAAGGYDESELDGLPISESEWMDWAADGQGAESEWASWQPAEDGQPATESEWAEDGEVGQRAEESEWQPGTESEWVEDGQCGTESELTGWQPADEWVEDGQPGTESEWAGWQPGTESERAGWERARDGQPVTESEWAGGALAGGAESARPTRNDEAAEESQWAACQAAWVETVESYGGGGSPTDLDGYGSSGGLAIRNTAGGGENEWVAPAPAEPAPRATRSDGAANATPGNLQRIGRGPGSQRTQKMALNVRATAASPPKTTAAKPTMAKKKKKKKKKELMLSMGTTKKKTARRIRRGCLLGQPSAQQPNQKRPPNARPPPRAKHKQRLQGRLRPRLKPKHFPAPTSKLFGTTRRKSGLPPSRASWKGLGTRRKA